MEIGDTYYVNDTPVGIVMEIKQRDGFDLVYLAMNDGIIEVREERELKPMNRNGANK